MMFPCCKLEKGKTNKKNVQKYAFIRLDGLYQTLPLFVKQGNRMIILDGYDKRFVKKSFQFWLCIILGAILSILVTAYSAYAGLKIGGVYWPILATSVTSLAILKISGKKDANLANIMQTAGNTGGMVAAGIIFTIPAAWMLGIEFTYIQITLIALIGSLLGLL